jgi:hypothetical protein
MSAIMKIAVGRQHFKVTVLAPRGKEVCVSFSRGLISWKAVSQYGVTRRMPDKVYAAASVSRQWFRFHIGCLEDFKTHLKAEYVTDTLVHWGTIGEYTPADARLKVKDGWLPRPDQESHIAYFCKPTPINKLLPLQTGGGKTFCSLYSAAQIGKRLAIFVKAMYVDKWVKDVFNILDIDKKKVCVVQGSAALKSVFNLATTGELNYDVMIFSISTVQDWIGKYELMGDKIKDLGFSCTPEDWMEKMGIGVKLVDEVHQHFHAMFKLDLYTQVPKSIALSATLISKDSFLRRIYTYMFPHEDRAPVPELKRYANAIAVHYLFKNPDKIRTTEFGSNQYSHGALEKSILKHPPTLSNYLKMIAGLVEAGYINHPKPSKKLAIYAATKSMCQHICTDLQRRYPDLDVRRYVDEDPYENAIDADIRVTTIGSMGTAIDVPDLTTVILTTALSSVQANIQVLGRLREIKDFQVYFYFLNADNIKKHLDYYEEKKILMRERAASMVDVHSNIVI